ncbi:MAG: type VI secretion system-associated protein TagF, partial [Ramlibacter sp.]
EAWDTWLQACMLESQRQLEEQWLTHYLTSPVWRFAISPGILGPEGLGGVMMPSVDRVGRYFPLMLAATGAPPLLDWFQKHAEWYDAIEELARASLDTEFRLEQFDGVAEPGVIPLAPFLSTSSAHRFSFHDDVDQQVIAAAMQGRSLWWTEGSPSVEASVLLSANMPGPQEFSAMLNGS